jgi:hypothetical protein
MLEALRENDGAQFRSLLLREPAPEMQKLNQRFLYSPDFRDLVPH